MSVEVPHGVGVRWRPKTCGSVSPSTPLRWLRHCRRCGGLFDARHGWPRGQGRVALCGTHECLTTWREERRA